MVFRILTVILLLIAAVSYPALALGNRPFGPDIPYYEALPNLLLTVGEEVEEAGEGGPLREFYEGKEKLLPEFLESWIKAVANLEHQTFPDYNIDEIEMLSEKWTSILLDYPRLRALEEIVNPILAEMVEDLPRLRSTRPGDVPMQNFAEFYRALEQRDPWKVGIFFRLVQLLRAEEVCTVHEKKQVVKENGVEEEKILRRESVLRRNGEVVFYELTVDDKVVERIIVQEDPTFMHEVLKEMRRNGEDPRLIRAVAWLVELMDAHLEEIGFEFFDPWVRRLMRDPSC